MRSRRASRGFTLIEVVVSMLITAVMVSSVFSVSMHTRRNDVRADRRAVAEQYTRQLTGSLEEYVTADHSTNTGMQGIAAFNAPGNSWQFPKELSNTCAGSGADATYALCAGSHTLQGYLPGWFEGAPYNARAVYFVGINSMAGSSTTWVSAAVTWNEP